MWKEKKQQVNYTFIPTILFGQVLVWIQQTLMFHSVKPNFLADWISRKLANLPGCLQLKAFNLPKQGNKFSVWSDGSIKGLEVFLFTSKVSRELGT